METKTKTINGEQYEISQPYEAGHQITEIEARVLNQTRSENIGNNVRSKLKEAQENGGTAEDLQRIVADLDSEYEFTAAAARAGAKLDPYEKEARKLARGLLKDYLAETGRKLTVAPEGMSEEEWEEKVEAETDRIAASDAVVKAAKQNVDARKKRADALSEAVEGASI